MVHQVLSANFGTGLGWHEGNFDGSDDGVQFADFLALSSNFGLVGENVFERSITHDGLERTFRVHLPKSYNGADKLPVIVALHGSAQGIKGPADADFLDDISGLTKRADEDGFIVVFPYGESGWNVGSCSPTWTGCRQQRDDTGFVAAAVDHLDANFAIDGARYSCSAFLGEGRWHIGWLVSRPIGSLQWYRWQEQ